jgi:hypothetical protein
MTGPPALSTWKGIKWLPFHEIAYTSTGQSTGNLDIHVSVFRRHYSCSSNGCTEQK